MAARTHQTMIWERTRQVQRLRHQLREYFPAALEAFEDLDAPDTLELLARAPDPARAARLTRAQVAAALKRARRRDIAGKTDAILAALRGEQLRQPQPLTEAYAAAVRSLTVIIAALNSEIATMERQVTACFRGHPDAAIYLSQPGIGEILGARELGEFGDDPHRYASAKARKNYAATSPVTRQSGRKKIVLARFIRNDRLADAVHRRSWWFIRDTLSGLPVSGCRLGHDLACGRSSPVPAAGSGMSCACSLPPGRSQIRRSRWRSRPCTAPGRRSGH